MISSRKKFLSFKPVSNFEQINIEINSPTQLMTDIYP